MQQQEGVPMNIQTKNVGLKKIKIPIKKLHNVRCEDVQPTSDRLSSCLYQTMNQNPKRQTEKIIYWTHCPNTINKSAWREVNTSDELKTSGNRKLSRAQSSCRLFWRGVPVRSRRLVVLNSRTISESYAQEKTSVLDYSAVTHVKVYTVSFLQLSDLWLLVLDPVSFIDHQVSPVELFEHGFFNNEHFVGRDADVPLSWQQDVSDQGSLHLQQTHFV